MNIKELLESIDISKMETKYVDIYSICEQEFDIYEYLNQHENRLTYCYYHSWTCTDTQVGLRVWYFDNEPVCISWKPYRKSDEDFEWLSKELFIKVRNYIRSLRVEDELIFSIIDDDTLNNVTTELKAISHKEFESFNIK